MAAGDDRRPLPRPLLGEAKRLNSADAIERPGVMRLTAGRCRPPHARGGRRHLPTASCAPTANSLFAEALAAVRYDIEADHDFSIRQPEQWAATIIEALDAVAGRLR
jgi:hypothetical protein